jgi:prepilin-type N-terminal cleavage/methylation domain-containing protein
MQNKGFTLIELLVVIAIIGILAGIIVVSMGGAQNSAKNAKVKATMDQMRSAAELYKIKNNLENYTGITSGDVGTLDAAVDEITGASNAVVFNTGSTKWCYSVTLLGDGAGDWCVDANGYAGVPVTDGCGATNAACLTAN